LRIRFLFAVILLLFASARAHADVGLILNESLDTSIGRITGSGHSAVYFSRICPSSPVKLRLCRLGEQGSVMSNYTTLGEEQPFEWNIAPLNVYLYGVSDAQDTPIFATEKIKSLLEQRYREKYLSDVCPGPPCSVSKKAEWREMVSATSSRSIYIFVVSTTLDQDEDLIDRYNARPNENHFNGFTRNCANFTREVINTYFPHAARPDYINNFGIVSPKAIARSFSRYAHRHPESDYQVLHFAQLPGTIKRSTVARDGIEQLYRSKKLLVPMIFLAGHELPIFAASYMLTGRFNAEHEYEQHASPLAAKLDYEIKEEKANGNDSLIDALKTAKLREQEEADGSPQEWARYRKEFDVLVADAVRDEIIPERDSVGHVFKELNEKGTATIDSQGALWLDADEGGSTIRVGLSASNIAGPTSDARLAYEILLAHVQQVIKSPAHSRESMPEFKTAWDLLQQVHGRLPISLAMQQKPNSAQ